MMRLNIVGSGNAGLTAAYCLAKSGHEVCLVSIPEFEATLGQIEKKNEAPESISHRYIEEDVPYLLVTCFEFATLLGIDTPILESTLHLASAMSGINYFQKGQRLEDLGLADLSPQQILQKVQ